MLIPLFLLIVFLNPLLNHYGTHELFMLFGKPYTLEALLFGVNTGFMFMSIMIWFMSMNAVMTTDKLTYILGNFIPSISLMLSMIIRFIPSMRKKGMEINNARMAIGKGVRNSSRKEGIANGMETLKSLTANSLEKGIVTADSMRARGYGSSKRTSFRIYRFKRKDIILGISFAVLSAYTLVSSIMGGMKYDYNTLVFSNTVWTKTGFSTYVIFLSLPFLLNILEELKWRSLRSKI
ncbi:MAG: energy-coupling factor transporter transmembrane protein EcfT [Clostridia bacterium]|nr:energy-coupling factor transporter transmembrane protein EcfT [Clostridia bacterium]